MLSHSKVITMWSDTEKSHTPIYHTNTKNEAKRLRATIFANAKLYLYGKQY